jgi:hypothetical protein
MAHPANMCRSAVIRMVFAFATLGVCGLNGAVAQTGPDAASTTVPAAVKSTKTQAQLDAEALVPRICELIKAEADKHGIQRDFFARLIWKESRFDHLAVSPAGAQGVAQFMPATAKAVRLANPFDIEQAIPASAAHLAELRALHGNLGRAAAAYNAGEGRLARWLNGGFLPIETENYILDITGEPAEVFLDAKREARSLPLSETMTFEQACLALPVIMARTPAMAQTLSKPWFIQVAGGFNRSAVATKWARLKPRVAALVGDRPVVLSRSRSPLGRRAIHVVRIGADNRAEADRLCAAIGRLGAACVVKRNV